ncbi:MAG: hypothetical protein P1U74_04855 [Legionellaceae bacterium]|nr:hypothetical protein [Legionellaceae bacterium]
MKKILVILLFIASTSLVGCATTQSNASENNKTQNSGTYFGTGIGVGFVSY